VPKYTWDNAHEMPDHYTWDDLDELRGPWRETFNEEMAYGFDVHPGIYVIVAECIRTKSQKPLDDYIASIPDDVMF